MNFLLFAYIEITFFVIVPDTFVVKDHNFGLFVYCLSVQDNSKRSRWISMKLGIAYRHN